MDESPGRASPLFSLPVELRSIIYQSILEEIVQPPLHPWDQLPTPKGYLSLLLVNREISAEVSDLFSKLYADKMTFYSDNIVDLYPMWKKRESWPILRNARFWSQALLEDTDSDGDSKHDGVLMLIDRRPGYKVEWDENPAGLEQRVSNFGSEGA